jgi:uncharacterized protein YuzE
LEEIEVGITMKFEESSQIPKSRAYYDTDAEVLGVDLLPLVKPVDTILEPVAFSLTENGRISQIELITKESEWKKSNIEKPEEVKRGSLIFENADFDKLDAEELSQVVFNPKKSLIYIKFKNKKTTLNVKIADNLSIDLSADDLIAGIWISNIDFNRQSTVKKR